MHTNTATASNRRYSLALPVLVMACLVLACATAGAADKNRNNFRKPATKEAPKEPKKEPKKEPRKESKKEEKEDSTVPGNLGKAVRFLGEKGQSIVLMRGLENQPVDKELASKLGDKGALERLVKATACDVQEADGYAFLYLNRQPYDTLIGLDAGPRLDPSLAELKASVAFGVGTKLFTAFAMLGQALDRTFVIDNTLAETPTGEVALKDATIEHALEAILKSSRLLGVGIDSTDEFVFVSGESTPPPRSGLLNPRDTLNDAQRAMLDKRIDLHLPVDPNAPQKLIMAVGAEPLKTALDVLSQQLGVTLVAEANLTDLPVNPVVMKNVRVETALDLLIRQWPVHKFGYEVQADRVLIRQRTASESEPPKP